MFTIKEIEELSTEGYFIDEGVKAQQVINILLKHIKEIEFQRDFAIEELEEIIEKLWRKNEILCARSGVTSTK